MCISIYACAFKFRWQKFINLQATKFVPSPRTSPVIIPNIFLGILLQIISLARILILHLIEDENNKVIICNCVQSSITNERTQNWEIISVYFLFKCVRYVPSVFYSTFEIHFFETLCEILHNLYFFALILLICF